jgi:hypothetical protein
MFVLMRSIKPATFFFALSIAALFLFFFFLSSALSLSSSGLGGGFAEVVLVAPLDSAEDDDLGVTTPPVHVDHLSRRGVVQGQDHTHPQRWLAGQPSELQADLPVTGFVQGAASDRPSQRASIASSSPPSNHLTRASIKGWHTNNKLQNTNHSWPVGWRKAGKSSGNCCLVATPKAKAPGVTPKTILSTLVCNNKDNKDM